MNKTPKLRFKEFSGDWESRKFGELIDKISGGGTPSRDNPDFYNGNIPWVTVKDLKDLKYINTASEFITELGLKNSSAKLAKQNDLIIPTRMAVGKILIAKGIIAINQDLKIVSLKENYNTEFMYYRYLNKSSYIEKLGVGSTVSGISMDDLNSLKFSIPKYKEQEKIASFFSLIDDKISLQGEKLEMLKDYKTGMMQKIFSRELRFKDDEGRDYPEWEEKKLKSILKEVSEKTKENNQHEVISSTTNGLFLQKEYFNREIASSDNTGYKIIRKNQVVLSPQNLWMGNINFNEKYDIGIVSPSYKIFDINDKFDSKYIGYVLRTPRAFYEFIQSSEQGASIVRRNLNMDLFNEISFDMPCKEEQVKISKFIGSIDLKIEKEQENLNSLNEYKKGLLQQMFV